MRGDLECNPDRVAALQRWADYHCPRVKSTVRLHESGHYIELLMRSRHDVEHVVIGLNVFKHRRCYQMALRHTRRLAKQMR